MCGADRVLEVRCAVGEPVGPGHDLALGRRGRRTGPRVVADAVERLGAQVERRQGDVGAPDGVVVPLGDEQVERVLARVATGPVAAVVPEGDGFGERHVQPQRPRDRGGDLGDLERVGEPGPLVVVGEDEHLRLAGQPAKGAGVQDAVAVAFEARAVRGRGPRAVARFPDPSALVAPATISQVLGELSLLPCDGLRRDAEPGRIRVRDDDTCRPRRCRAWCWPTRSVDRSSRGTSGGFGHGAMVGGVCDIDGRGRAPRWPYPCPVSNFVDECGLNLKGGDGGAGCVSFRREAHVDRGGPDGGDGGNGGDVWLVADRNVASLLAFRDHPHRKATSGSHGSGKKQHGSSGDDLIVRVPVGTVVRTQDGEVLADLVHDGDRWLGAQGGAGRQGQRPVPVEQATCPGVRRAGRVRRGALARAGAEADGRRGAGGVPQRREVHADLTHLRRPAQDRRLSLHHPGAQPGRGAHGRRREHRSRWSLPTSRG